MLGQTINRLIKKDQIEAMHHLQLAQANSQITLFTATSMPREVSFVLKIASVTAEWRETEDYIYIYICIHFVTSPGACIYYSL